MKSIILYASKHGATKEIAKKVSAKTTITNVLDIKSFNGDINEYDCIVIGASVYVGSIHKKIKELCLQINPDKKVVFYLVGLSENKLEEILEKNLSKEFISTINYKDFVGGKLNFPSMNIMEKGIIKVINKETKFVDKIDTKSIYDFIKGENLNKLIEKIKEIINN